jgi:hypothetical protein
MRLDKHIGKLMVIHGRDPFLSTVIRAVDSTKVLLSLSNYFMLKASEGRVLGKKDQEKLWRKRAKIIHDIMEEIEAENGQIGKEVG